MSYTKLIQSGNLLEAYIYEKNTIPYQFRAQSAKARNKKYRKAHDRRADNVRRLSLNFRRLIRANLVGASNPIFVTLTMHKKLHITEAWRAFTTWAFFIRRYRPSVCYIVVPEYQKRGAIHFHALIWGINDLHETERSTRYLARSWGYGFCDTLQTDGSPKLASYLAKYMSKTLQDQRLGGAKAYSASRNVMRPVCISSNGFTEETITEIIDETKLKYQKSFDTYFLGKGQYSQYY